MNFLKAVLFEEEEEFEPIPAEDQEKREDSQKAEEAKSVEGVEGSAAGGAGRREAEGGSESEAEGGEGDGGGGRGDDKDGEGAEQEQQPLVGEAGKEAGCSSKSAPGLLADDPAASRSATERVHTSAEDSADTHATEGPANWDEGEGEGTAEAEEVEEEEWGESDGQLFPSLGR